MVQAATAVADEARHALGALQYTHFSKCTYEDTYAPCLTDVRTTGLQVLLIDLDHQFDLLKSCPIRATMLHR